MCVQTAVFIGCLLVKLHILVKLLCKPCYHLDGEQRCIYIHIYICNAPYED